ncbi:hypothetical protein FQR65_LT15804 [Abscondita terminalis]|nr:hypothetical protein FQR65_LT15804 [Abscondita terminalis]
MRRSSTQLNTEVLEPTSNEVFLESVEGVSFRTGNKLNVSQRKLHRESSCAAKRRRTENEAGSSSDVWCEKCTVHISSSFYSTHLHSNPHKKNAFVIIDDGVEKIASPFGSKIVVYRVSGNKHYVDVNEFCHDIREKVLSLEINDNDETTDVAENDESSSVIDESLDPTNSQEIELDVVDEVENPSEGLQTRKLPEKPKRGRQRQQENPLATEALKILKDTHSRYVTSTQQDRFVTYGQHVGNKIRSYDPTLQNIVEHEINTVLFKADMGQYSYHSYNINPYSSGPIQHPNLSRVYPSTSATTPSPTPTPSSSTAATPSLDPLLTTEQFYYDNSNTERLTIL